MQFFEDLYKKFPCACMLSLILYISRHSLITVHRKNSLQYKCSEIFFSVSFERNSIYVLELARKFAFIIFFSVFFFLFLNFFFFFAILINCIDLFLKKIHLIFFSDQIIEMFLLRFFTFQKKKKKIHIKTTFCPKSKYFLIIKKTFTKYTFS